MSDSPPSHHYDVLIIGAGAAGLMCAIEAGRRQRSVLVVDHSRKLGGKILISGGGRCNFTNIGASAIHYVSENPHFVKSALFRFPPQEIIKRVESHSIPYHEKKLGQLFCDRSAEEIVEMLKQDCLSADVKILLETTLHQVIKNESSFTVTTSGGDFTCDSFVVASGGLSLPKLGATGVGYQIAKQFGLRVTPTSPALDGFVWSESDRDHFVKLAGVSTEVLISSGGLTFLENVLFTHSGLSGPAALQASLHWKAGSPVTLNFSPQASLYDFLVDQKRQGNRAQLKTVLGLMLPTRLAEVLVQVVLPEQTQPLTQIPDRDLRTLADRIHTWSFIPQGTVGYSKAEVTRGGVDTNELSSKTLESKKVPGLYFIGEVVDVTGWLGGYNFQWAWASGWAAGQVV